MTVSKRVKVSRCPSCQVKPGVAHQDGCHTARCVQTGLQRVMCALFTTGQFMIFKDGTYRAVEPADVEHDCGAQMWDGTVPGTRECVQFGWFVVNRCWEGGGWERCDADTLGAEPDLNRLFAEARWDESLGRWVKTDTLEAPDRLHIGMDSVYS